MKYDNRPKCPHGLLRDHAPLRTMARAALDAFEAGNLTLARRLMDLELKRRGAK